MKENELKNCYRIDKLVLTNTQICLECKYRTKCEVSSPSIEGVQEVYKLYKSGNEEEAVKIARYDCSDKDGKIKLTFYNLRG